MSAYIKVLEEFMRKWRKQEAERWLKQIERDLKIIKLLRAKGRIQFDLPADEPIIVEKP